MTMRQSYTAIVARNEPWQGASATEPYEAAWAGEAIFFVRLLEASGPIAGTEAVVQISPDGMRWVDEGTRFPMPVEAGPVTFGKVAHFGTHLRLRAELPAGASAKVLVTLDLKE